MTDEQKLIILLRIAEKNNCGNKEIIAPLFYLESMKARLGKDELCLCLIVRENNDYYSLNDLISNCEKIEDSFIYALCLNSEAEKIIKEWFFDKGKIRPSSERLEYLFKTFNHLLKDE